ncbi:hypothetical protein BX265_8184 [Streptomyces sp. TLI_235]|nr:hypothetical protein [Streptomyces sp. TLI_235]PBC67572.1 hypothetical protein BX265_8184 [Streptomyces sp. TLI_235]
MSRSLRGLTAALLADDGDAPWPANVPARLDALLANLPRAARASLHAAATALDAYAALRTGARLDRLTPAERETVMAALAARPALLPLLDAVKIPVVLAAGTERLLHHRTSPPVLPAVPEDTTRAS